MTDNPGVEPYRGARSYRVQDRALFFGRDDDVDRIRALVLADRITLLHAPSGAGKTSLIRTLLIPQLEVEQYAAVLCRPGRDPATAVRAATLARVLPPPSAELRTIRKIAEHLTQDTAVDELPLAVIKQRYRHLKPDDPAHGQIVDDVELHQDSPMRVPGAPTAVTPVMARFLYLPIGAPSLVAYLARLEAGAGDQADFWRRLAASGRARDVQDVMGRYTLGELRAFLEQVEQGRWHRDFVDRCDIDGSSDLADFFARLERETLLGSERQQIILILDQFEEFFTLFGERSEATRHSASSLIDYTRREAFFRNLGGLLARRAEESEHDEPLSVRLLVSMRDDYVARIDELERQIGPIETRRRYHLSVLTPEASRDVIREPARLFGYDYDDELYEQIVDALTEEGEKVEPGHIQIVCKRLWNDYGKALHARRSEADTAGGQMEDGSDLDYIRPRDLDDLGGVRGILESHFREFLAPYNDIDRVEILDMLAPLITSRHTRNIVMMDVITRRRFVDRRRREVLLNHLRDNNIVRVETHRSGALVEITHEFLIRPIEEETVRAKERVKEWVSLIRAFERLEIIENQGFRTVVDGLETDELKALFWYRDRLDQDHVGRWLAEAQLRLTILDTSEDEERHERLAYWAEKIDEERPKIDAQMILTNLSTRAEQNEWLDHWELDALAAAEFSTEITADDQLFLLESAIKNASRDTTSAVIERYWE